MESPPKSPLPLRDVKKSGDASQHAADRAKGAIPVRVAVRVPEEEEGIYLKPEMSAVVVFYGSPDSKAAPD